MAYQVKKISNKNQIETCERFAMNQYMWGSRQQPKTYGWLGYIEGEGLYVRMVCEEQNPKREHQNHRDMVCEDSAMEIFFAFTEGEEALTNDSMYLNFEINANGAMYAKYGKGRNNRTFLTDEQYEMTGCRAAIGEESWSIEVLFPEGFLKEVCEFEEIKNGKTFYCNFYKIAECEEIEHYGSYSPIDNETPNFHLPVFFAEARM